MNKFQKEKLKALNKLYRERAYVEQKALHLAIHRIPKIRSIKKMHVMAMKLFNLSVRYQTITFDMLAVAAQPMPNKFPKGGSCSEVMITDLPIHCDPYHAYFAFDSARKGEDKSVVTIVNGSSRMHIDLSPNANPKIDFSELVMAINKPHIK